MVTLSTEDYHRLEEETKRADIELLRLLHERFPKVRFEDELSGAHMFPVKPIGNRYPLDEDGIILDASYEGSLRWWRPIVEFLSQQTRIERTRLREMGLEAVDVHMTMYSRSRWRPDRYFTTGSGR